MLFVDGENFTIRTQEYAKESGFAIPPCKEYLKDVYLWPFTQGNAVIYQWLCGGRTRSMLSFVPTRLHYYTSMCGDDDLLREAKGTLWDFGLDAQVFKKSRRDTKAKGVDIALTKDMLVHAFYNHYEVAVLVAGDGDYVPLVEEVKRHGKRVICVFVNTKHMSRELILACDEFKDISEHVKYWAVNYEATPKP
jgi:uncharacterized LabA/DUF88 family protein